MIRRFGTPMSLFLRGPWLRYSDAWLVRDSAERTFRFASIAVVAAAPFLALAPPDLAARPFALRLCFTILGIAFTVPGIFLSLGMMAKFTSIYGSVVEEVK